ncbi:MAG TPA: substrate-binding domain-containing protein, partial [Ktedonobacteraceae bacterium]|nr:substrate-binding domain-containing protein [Ktedonobacteraceae bacterium]
MKLFGRTSHKFSLTAFLLVIVLLLAACGSANTGGNQTGTTGPSNGKGCKKVGILLPETATSARWDNNDRPQLIQQIQQVTGQMPDYNNAEGSADTQLSQAEADLTKGDCILVVAPSDSSKAAAIVTKAKQSNVPVIAYDRLIQSSDLNYYVSFDGVQVGQLQGQYIV